MITYPTATDGQIVTASNGLKYLWSQASKTFKAQSPALVGNVGLPVLPIVTASLQVDPVIDLGRTRGSFLSTDVTFLYLATLPVGWEHALGRFGTGAVFWGAVGNVTFQYPPSVADHTQIAETNRLIYAKVLANPDGVSAQILIKGETA